MSLGHLRRLCGLCGLFDRLDKYGPITFLGRRDPSQPFFRVDNFFVLPGALPDVQPTHADFVSLRSCRIQYDIAAAREKYRVCHTGVGGAEGLIGAAFCQQVVVGGAGEDVDLIGEVAQRT